MKINRILPAVLVLGFAGPAHAVEPQVAAQIASLTNQVAALQGEVATLKALLSQDASGNVTQTAIGDRHDRVGRNHSTTVGQSNSHRVGGASTETIGADRSARIGGNDSLSIRHDQALSIGGSQSQQIGGGVNVTAAREIVVTAGDQLTLRSGSARIELRKDGSVVIHGVDIDIKGSANVSVKGARVLTNN